jgi:hypothetical protein
VAIGAIGLLLIGQFIRFRQKISLRTLLIIVTVLSIGLAYVGRHITDARNEDAAIEQLLEVGARIEYSGPKQHDREYFRTENGWLVPIWTKNWLGAGFFSPVKAISLGDPKIADKHLVLLAEIREVETLELWSKSFTAVGVVQMPLPPGVREMTLSWECVSPESLAHLANMPELQKLYVRPQDPLQLPGNNSPPMDLMPFAELTKINSLRLYSYSQFDVAGIRTLAQLPALQSLDLICRDPRDYDASFISAISESKTIRDLQIGIFSFSDAELKSLEKMASLNFLRLGGTSVTADGVRAFRAARPNVGVQVHPPIPGLDDN